MGRLGPERRVVVAYDRLCRAPRDVLKDIESLLAQHGIRLRQKREVPESFATSVPVPLDDETESLIARAMNKIWGERHTLYGRSFTCDL